METYCENTAASTLYLTLECLGVRDFKADRAISHIGKATGLVTLLRGTPYNCSKKQPKIPIDLMRECEFHNQESMLRGENSKELSEVIFQIASRAKVHLNSARGMAEELPKESLPALLPALALDQYLEQLRKADFDIFDPSLAKSGHVGLQLQLMKHSWMNTF